MHVPEPLDRSRAAHSAPERSKARPYGGRTWELELLISGAITYGLLQLPSEVDAWFVRAETTTTGATAGAVASLYAYTKVILYALIGGFLLHLTTRTYWVALIGLNSVFPRGVRWERLNYGPITEAVYRERQPPLRSLIRRVDRMSSVILSGSFVVVLIFVSSVLLIGFLGVIALGISWLLFDGEQAERIMDVLLVIGLGTIVLVLYVDRWFGKRISRQGGFGRVLDRMTRGTYSVMLGAMYFPLINILLSNFNRRVANAALLAMMIGLFALFLVRDVALPRGRLTVDGFEFFPQEAGALGVDARHYESRRSGPERSGPVPSIQSDIVRDPFVRLFIPYLPRRHNDAIRERCPGVEPFQEPGLRLPPRNAAPPPHDAMQAALGCFAHLHRVRLNGRPVTPAFHFFAHPATGQRGVVAYLPVDSLPTGENLLVVEGTPGRKMDDGEFRPAETHSIPFWIGR